MTVNSSPKNNAYNILGIDIAATEKEITKRSKEIISRIIIDDVPEYDLDTDLLHISRTEVSVKEAAQKLSAPKKKVKEFFFWFQIIDGVDKQAFGLVKNNDFFNACQVWQIASQSQTTKSFGYKKNLAILYCALLTKEDNENYLTESLSIWKEIVESDKFWNYFYKFYNLHNDLDEDKEVIDQFRNQVNDYLSDIYTELYQTHKNPSFISEFREVFSNKGTNVDKNVLEPIYFSINNSINNLGKMRISEDGILNKDEIEEIKLHIGLIQSEFNKLIDIGHYDESQTKVMRDKAATAIRSIVLDLHNNLSETDKALKLLNVALKIVGTSGLKEKINQDINIILELQKNTDLIEPINVLVTQERYSEAIDMIETDQKKYNKNQNLTAFYNNQKKLCISSIALKKYVEAKEYFDKNRIDEAKPIFEESGKLIYDNIDLFDFNIKVVDKILDEIHSQIAKLKSNNIGLMDEYRDSYIKLAKEKFEGQFEEMAFIVLIDSHIFAGTVDVIKKVRRKSGIVNFLYTIGWLTVFYYGIGLIFFLIGWIYSREE